MTYAAKKTDEDFDHGRLQFHISNVIEAAEHGAENFIRSIIVGMTHQDFEGMPIVFKLSKDPCIDPNRELIEKVIREHTSKDFQDRVSFA